MVAAPEYCAMQTVNLVGEDKLTVTALAALTARVYHI
jgi:hypothetical protein